MEVGEKHQTPQSCSFCGILFSSFQYWDEWPFQTDLSGPQGHRVSQGFAVGKPELLKGPAPRTDATEAGLKQCLDRFPEIKGRGLYLTNPCHAGN